MSRNANAYRKLREQLQRRGDSRCYRCGEPVDWSLPAKDPMTGRFNPLSASIEHKIPVSYRPDLEYDMKNVTVSHLGCNIHAGDRIEIQNAQGANSQRW